MTEIHTHLIDLDNSLCSASNLFVLDLLQLRFHSYLWCAVGQTVSLLGIVLFSFFVCACLCWIEYETSFSGIFLHFHGKEIRCCTVLVKLGPISLTYFHSYFKFIGNFVLLFEILWNKDHNKILHMTRQVGCCVMCTNLWWSDSQQLNYNKQGFINQIINERLVSKLVSIVVNCWKQK